MLKIEILEDLRKMNIGQLDEVCRLTLWSVQIKHGRVENFKVYDYKGVFGV